MMIQDMFQGKMIQMKTIQDTQYNIHTVQYGHYTIYTIQNAHSEHVQIGHYAQCTLVTGYNAHYHSTTLYSIEHTTHSNQYMHTVCYAHDYILNTTNWFVSHTVFLIDLGLGEFSRMFQEVFPWPFPGVSLSSFRSPMIFPWFQTLNLYV